MPVLRATIGLGMTRQTWTALVSALLFVALAVPLAILPVPFVAWSPGGTADVLGEVDGRPLISIEGVPTFPTSGPARPDRRVRHQRRLPAHPAGGAGGVLVARS